MNFQEAESYLLSLGNEVETMKLGLENITTLLAALGDPQKKYVKVQVAGTNGKGSVCAFLDSICLEAGIKAGIYTSPHLVSITERIRIGGEDIPEERFALLATRVRTESERLVSAAELERVPTFFEQVTAIALLAFAASGVELAVLETGLGGRFDATTAANAEIAVITRIDLDHQEYLGDTIEKIAAEKAAIIRGDSRAVIVGEQSPEARRVLFERCWEFGIIPRPGEQVRTNPVGESIDFDPFGPIKLGLKGTHQVENAKVAIRIVEALIELYSVERKPGMWSFSISITDVVDGLERAKHPGRLEYIGNVLLDGAHNIGGARELGKYLDESVTGPITIIFGAMRDKNVKEIAQILWPKAKKLILTRPANSRAMNPDELASLAPDGLDDGRILLAGSAAEALGVATQVPSVNLIVVTGSLYLVGEVKKLLADAAHSRSEI